MNETTIKSIAAAALLASWVFLVAMKMADVAPLVDFIKYALGGLAAHTLMGGSK